MKLNSINISDDKTMSPHDKLLIIISKRFNESNFSHCSAISSGIYNVSWSTISETVPQLFRLRRYYAWPLQKLHISALVICKITIGEVLTNQDQGKVAIFYFCQFFKCPFYLTIFCHHTLRVYNAPFTLTVWFKYGGFAAID